MLPSSGVLGEASAHFLLFAVCWGSFPARCSAAPRGSVAWAGDVTAARCGEPLQLVSPVPASPLRLCSGAGASEREAGRYRFSSVASP